MIKFLDQSVTLAQNFQTLIQAIGLFKVLVKPTKC